MPTPAEKLIVGLRSHRDQEIKTVERFPYLREWMEKNLWINSKDFGYIPFSMTDKPGSAVSYAWQGGIMDELFLEHKCKNYKRVVLKDRQCGSTTTFLGAGFTCSHEIPGYHGLILYQDEDTANERKRDIIDVFYDNLPDDVRKPTITNNEDEIMFANGSVIRFKFAAPGRVKMGKGRGGTYQYIIVTECAYFPNFEQIWAAYSPSLAKNGWIIIESTPSGHGGFRRIYFKAKDRVAGMEDWDVIFLGRDKLYGSEEGKRLVAAKAAEFGEDYIKQEYPENDLDCWLTEGGYFFNIPMCEEQLKTARICTMGTEEQGPVIEKFSFDMVQQCLVDDPLGDLHILQGPVKKDYDQKDQFGRPLMHDGRYVIAADCSSGGGYDSNVGVIGYFDEQRIIGEYGSNTIKPTQFAARLYLLGKWYNWALIAVEVTGSEWGRQVLDYLRNMHYPNLYTRREIDKKVRKPVKYWGWDTNTKTRPIILSRLRDKVDNGMLSNPFIRFWEETLTFRDVEGKLQAEEDYHDDYVMATAICNYVMETYVWVIDEEPDEDYLGIHDVHYYFKNKGKFRKDVETVAV